jgi:hypothetical protein
MIVSNLYNRGSIRCYYCFDPTYIKPIYAKLTEDKEKGRYYLGVLECEAIGQSLIHWLNQLVNGDQRRPALRSLLNRKPGHKGDLTACGKVPDAARSRMQRGAGCGNYSGFFVIFAL